MACSKCECEDCRRKSVTHKQWIEWINSFPGDLSKYKPVAYGQNNKDEELVLTVTLRKLR